MKKTLTCRKTFLFEVLKNQDLKDELERELKRSSNWINMQSALRAAHERTAKRRKHFLERASKSREKMAAAKKKADDLIRKITAVSREWRNAAAECAEMHWEAKQVDPRVPQIKAGMARLRLWMARQIAERESARLAKAARSRLNEYLTSGTTNGGKQVYEANQVGGSVQAGGVDGARDEGDQHPGNQP